MRCAPFFLMALLPAACAAPQQSPPFEGHERPPPLREATVAGAAPQREPVQVAGGAASCAEDSRIKACIAVPYDSHPPTSLAMALSPSAIALAWGASSAAASAPSHSTFVGLFRSDLAFLGQHTILSSAAFGPSEVAIAALPRGGFFIATTTYTAVELYSIDASDRVSRLARMDYQGAHAPFLVSRPDGGPLLVWSTWEPQGPHTYAALLDEAGKERWRVHLFKDVTEPRLGSAVFAGDGFLVAQRVGSAVTVVRVGLDGRTGPPQAPGGSSTEYPQLAWSGSGAFLTWSDFSGQGNVRWAALDGAGARIVGPVVLGTIPNYFNPAPPTAWGQDTLVLLGGYTGGTGGAKSLDFTRLDRSGRTLVPPWPLLSGPALVTDYRVGRMGDEVVVAWLGGARYHMHPATSIGLAKVSP